MFLGEPFGFIFVFQKNVYYVGPRYLGAVIIIIYWSISYSH